MAPGRSKSDGGRGAPTPGEIYLEFVTLEKALRVAAVDAATGTEVVFTTPANEPRHRIEALAIAKLTRRMALDSGMDVSSEDASTLAPQTKGKGRLV